VIFKIQPEMTLSDKTPSVEEYIPLHTLPRSGFWQC